MKLFRARTAVAFPQLNNGPARAISRREFLFATGAAAAGTVLEPAASLAADAIPTRAARSTPLALMPAATQEAMRKVTGGAAMKRDKVTLALPQLVDNGNGVTLGVQVESPMSEAEHVRAIHVFTEKNPLPEVVSFHLGQRAGRASVNTRIRLADTQTVVAIAELSDGSFWYATADSVVTMSSCLEEL